MYWRWRHRTQLNTSKLVQTRCRNKHCHFYFQELFEQNKSLLWVIIYLLCLQRSLYISGRMTSQVRLLQGQTILEDDRKLCEYSLPEGAIISALFEPDVDIDIRISMGEEVWHLKVSNATSIMALKVQVCGAINCGTAPEKLEARLEDVILEDAMPLHFYNIVEGSLLMFLKPYVGVRIENNHGTVVFWRINRKDTIKKIKAKLATVKSSDASAEKKFSFSQNGTQFNGYVSGGHQVDDGMSIDGMRLYLVAGGKFRELDDDDTIQDCKIKDNGKLYLLIYRWTKECSVEALKTGRKLWGVEEADTCLGIKVKFQDQLGIPVATLKLFYEQEQSFGPWFVSRRGKKKDYHTEQQIDDEKKPASHTRKIVGITKEELQAEEARRQEEERQAQLERRHKRSAQSRRPNQNKTCTQSTYSVYDRMNVQKLILQTSNNVS